ncbi:FAD binding domain-containing protein [Actinomadura decatromicini]|uniref:Xanthine dehydrogenase family protein subunit M n=1 Tax=Actinomadura decatromicini TaxID=2604572 RepID=A0A5D3FL67_9ACTN|nr:FAD binding domain-containing protein [Actinomadura decatromicini]TYK48963.1 xanthine dehydrogenase family protein subunit M [Actinomadura decatromicini]
MDFLRPATWDDALAAKAEQPDALPVQGGTDVMVEINFAARRPAALLDLTRIGALADWDTADGRLRVGAGVTYARLITELGGRLPGLAQASRTVGSPQIRNRGTVGGNLGAASPAGDGHPPLLAGDAVVEAESAARGVRMIPAAEFFTGVKRHALAPDELIRAFWIAPASGPQYFAKIGTRNAMVIAVCSFAIALHPAERRVGTGLGSAAPTPRRAPEAEDFISAELDWDGRGPLSEPARRRFGELVAAASAPIDDVRGTGAYRAHALAVLARRTLTWAWNDHRKEARRCA